MVNKILALEMEKNKIRYYSNFPLYKVLDQLNKYLDDKQTDISHWHYKKWGNYIDRDGCILEVEFVDGNKEEVDQIIEQATGVKPQYV